MLLKLIACNVFAREASHCLARSPNVIDAEFLEVGEHVHPDQLRALLQARIDAADAVAKQYDAILLLYGLCGNAGVGLRAGSRTRLVMPRAHDCCTVLLGSRERFREHFQDCPSTPFSSAGYMERGDYYLRVDAEGNAQIHYGDGYTALVEQYGEDNAKFIWESMHPADLGAAGNRAVYIDIAETAHLGYRERFRDQVAKDGKEFVCLTGSLDLVRRLLDGPWDPAEFLTVEPGQQTAGVYDWSEIIRARPAAVTAG